MKKDMGKLKLRGNLIFFKRKISTDFYKEYQFNSVQLLVMSDSLWPMDCSMPGFPVHHQLPEPAQTHGHRVGNAMQPSNPLSSLLLPPSVFPSIRVFSNESALCFRWPKYWSFSFNISPSDEHSGLIPLEWTGWISLQSKGLSRVSPTPQFKSINFSALSFLYSPTLTFIQDYWKNHSLE